MSAVIRVITAQFEEDWQTWRAERDRDLRDPHGFLSLTALHWLTDTETSYPGTPGRWRADADRVILVATAADGLERDGVALSGEVSLRPADGTAGVALWHGDRVVEVIRRGDAFAVRVRDPEATTLAAFTAVPTYAPDPGWAVPARFEPYPADRAVETGAVVPGLTHRHRAVGELVFQVDGIALRLVAFADRNGLRVLFTDTTTGVTTYPGARALTVPAPDEYGDATLDFNRATNLPCAFTDYATCPLAPPENRLPLAVTAGERNPE